MENSFSPYALRRIILEQSKRAGVGHIGSSLSVADIIVALYRDVLNIPSLQDQNRDRFVLSKGHAALALYAALFLRKIISKDELESFCGDGTAVGVHPEHVLRGVDFSTGSLGHGLSIGAGAALAARLQDSDRRVFVLISDAECNEGSLWEAVMFSAHHKLSNLIAIIDLNGQQALGYTKDICDLAPLEQKWKAFGWDVRIIDGHNVTEIVNTINVLNTNSASPHVLLAQTTFGKGVSYMESQLKWHYWPMSDDEFELALREIEETV
ncbi:MAG: transketolase [Anaerolineales bacterium]|nr:transketolase [Chloroflexota bacterium]MBL6980732.1 transketolase [Anaerolineales bacterium]